MGSVYPRGTKLWIKFKSTDGKWTARPTEFKVGQEKQARSLLEIVEKKIEAGAAFAEAELGPVKLSTYATRWLEQREGRVRSIADERTRITRHVLPRLGEMKLTDIRPRHVRDLVLELRAAGRLAPRTIRNIYGILHALLRDAVVDELIENNPCVLKKGVLPKKMDKDPAWRSTAIFTREEVEALISDDRILLDRRIVYALKGLAGLRHGEVAGLKWSRYDAAAAPLGQLTIASSYQREGTKTGVTRLVPVHPTLARLLAEWKLSGWESTFGRKPKPEDLIVPTRNFNVRNKKDAHEGLLHDLELLGLRRRRGHDFRRTFITLAQVDGARRDLLEVVTHGPRGDITSMYTTFPWPALCAEVAKLKISIREGKVLEMQRAVGALGTPLGTDQEKGPGTSRIPSPSVVTPPGLEPGISA